MLSTTVFNGSQENVLTSLLNFRQRVLFRDVAPCPMMFLCLLVPLISLSYNKVSGWVCQPLIQVPQSLDIQV